MLENISHLSKQYHSKIDLLTSHLREKLGIHYFARQSVTNQGEWEVISNLPEWLDYTADQSFYLLDPSLKHPDHYQSGILISSSQQAPDFLSNISNDFKNIFGLDHMLCIFHKNENGGDWYFFACDSNNYKATTVYLSQIKTIYRFINYFNQEAKVILNKNNDYKINLEQLTQVPFKQSGDLLELMPQENEIFWPPDIHLSPREKDCLVYLIKGKSIKETAKILGISPRTVEDYIKSLKIKMNCQYKRELIALFD